MKVCFLSMSFKNRQWLQPEIAIIQQVLETYGIELNTFVEKYNFKLEEEKAMMDTACAEIRLADLMIAEVSEKAIGVGIELGFAVALNKPVLYLRKAGSEYSTTVGGITQYHIAYHDLTDLEHQLKQTLNFLLFQKNNQS